MVCRNTQELNILTVGFIAQECVGKQALKIKVYTDPMKVGFTTTPECFAKKTISERNISTRVCLP